MRKTLVLVLGVLLLSPAIAGADSILPASYSATIAVGGTATLDKTVSVTQIATGAVDVFFLADTTGSMGGALSNVQSNINTIISTVSASASNVAYGAGDYKDNGDVYVYRSDVNPTTDTSGGAGSIQQAVNGWVASGGGDGPEAQLYALQQVATTTAWRADSERLLFWFGDYEGHDPSGPTGVTQAGAISALQAANVNTYAMSVGANRLDLLGQASAIASATGGTFTSGINPANLSAAILAAITGAVTNYSVVSLDVVGLAPGLTVSFTPGSYSGAYDRSIDRLFGFNVGFTGNDPGTYNFEIVARVDGAIVARESDSITVTGTSAVPEPASLLLVGVGLCGFAAFRRRR